MFDFTHNLLNRPMKMVSVFICCCVVVVVVVVVVVCACVNACVCRQVCKTIDIFFTSRALTSVNVMTGFPLLCVRVQAIFCVLQNVLFC